jgi:peptidylprolyl isomerase
MAKTKTKRTAARQSGRIRQMHSQSLSSTSRSNTERYTTVYRGRRQTNPFMSFVKEFPLLTGIVTTGILIAFIASGLNYMQNNKLAWFAPPPADTSCNWATKPNSIETPKDIVRKYDAAPKNCITKDTKGLYLATIKTDRGDIVTVLDQSQAPVTINNFIFLASHHFYDGLKFHRVETIVIQGGDPKTVDPSVKEADYGTGGPGYTIEEEKPADTSVYKEGCFAMAKSSAAHSTGSQFFICTADDSQTFSADYSPLGHVLSGMDIAKQIQKNDVIKQITISYDDKGTAGQDPTPTPVSTPTSIPAKTPTAVPTGTPTK